MNAHKSSAIQPQMFQFVDMDELVLADKAYGTTDPAVSMCLLKAKWRMAWIVHGAADLAACKNRRY